MLSLGLVNIFNDNEEIYLFHRGNRKLNIMKEKTFRPYFYEPSINGIYRGYFGGKFDKITFQKPYMLKKEMTDKSMEADVDFCKRYLIDRVNIIKTDVRWIMFDIETKSKNLPDPTVAPDPITCITCYDNYTQKYTTFWTKNYLSEYEMLSDFIAYIIMISPDIMMAWNGFGYDYPYLCARIPDFAMSISPIGKVGWRNGFPAGIAIVDYMEWVKKVYKYKRYSLEYVYCDAFKLPFEPKRYNFDSVADDIREKNILDVKKMVQIEEKLRLVPYFDELRRLSKCVWEDLTHNSVIVDGKLLQVGKARGTVLPTKPNEQEKMKRSEDSIIGGYVFAKSGRFDDVDLFDVGGTYPNLIITFNLDPSNIRKESSERTTTVNGIHIFQNPTAIVPTVCSELVHSRAEIQKQLETVVGDEAALLKKKDEAHKSVNNTVYGTLLFKSSRFYNRDVASTITYLARFLIRYTKYYLMGMGFEVVASDTDSIFVINHKDAKEVNDLINNIIIPKWLKHFGKDSGTLKFKYEGRYQNLFILTKKHYMGNFVTTSGEKKFKEKGTETVRASATKFQEKFQKSLIEKILAKETKDNIISWIKEEIIRLKTLPVTEISLPVKLSKDRESYKTEAIHIRALRYAQEANPEWQVNVGQDYYFSYIIPTEFEIKPGLKKSKKKNKETGEIVTTAKEIEIQKPKNVWAFDEFNSLESREIDWEEMTRRNVFLICEVPFKALGWSMKDINPDYKEKKSDEEEE